MSSSVENLDDGVTNGQDLELQEHAGAQEEELNLERTQDQPQNMEQSPEANSMGISSSSSSLLRGRVSSGERGSGVTSMRIQKDPHGDNQHPRKLHAALESRLENMSEAVLDVQME